MNDFIKDADCTKDTPVKLGVRDAPIYGNGISIKPKKTIDEVPEKIREEVKAILTEKGFPELTEGDN